MSSNSMVNGVIDGDHVRVQQPDHPLDDQRILIAYQHPGVDLNDGDPVTCQYATHPTYGHVASDPRPINL